MDEMLMSPFFSIQAWDWHYRKRQWLCICLWEQRPV